jgi:hypothetical protein
LKVLKPCISNPFCKTKNLIANGCIFLKSTKIYRQDGIFNILIIMGQTIIILIVELNNILFSILKKQLWLIVKKFDINQWTIHFTLLSPNYIFNGRTFYNLKITITICKIKFIMRHQFAWRDQNLTMYSKYSSKPKTIEFYQNHNYFPYDHW